MGNPTAQYENLIQALCRTAAIEGWSEIAASQHMRIGDQLIGLVPDIQSDPPMLSIYIELGQTYMQSDAALYARMLEANLSLRQEMPGHFGLHPETKMAVYKFSMGLEEMDGHELAAFLDSQIELSKAAMGKMIRPD